MWQHILQDQLGELERARDSRQLFDAVALQEVSHARDAWPVRMVGEYISVKRQLLMPVHQGINPRYSPNTFLCSPIPARLP